MHPSIALQVAERELQEESAQLPQTYQPPPPPFLHFAPRWHQRRRTMTGVLAGYFDLPPRPEPLPILPGAQALLARTSAPAVSDEELIRLENERKRREALLAKRGRALTTKPRRRETDTFADVVVSDAKRVHNRSSSRSDSPLTDFKVLSDESTPPLTPMSAKSDNPFQEALRSTGEKNGDYPYSFTVRIQPPTAASKPTAPRQPTTNSTAGKSKESENKERSENKDGRKRKREETPPKQTNGALEPIQQRRKSRPGWKGWVEVEGSPEPRTKLINLDSPIEVLGKRTRSGKVAPTPTNTLSVRSRKTSTVSGSVASSTPAPTDGPLGIVSGNSPLETNKGEV